MRLEQVYENAVEETFDLHDTKRVRNMARSIMEHEEFEDWFEPVVHVRRNVRY